MDTPLLFQSISLGPLTLQHRVVYAPLTRYRTSATGVPLPHVKDHYAQRASTPGTLLISEATVIAPQAGGYAHVPGIWSPQQILAWKKIVDTVHAEGSFIFCQLWATGRCARPEILRAQGLPYVSASDVKHPERSCAPRPLTVEEVGEYVRLYAVAADNAVNKAGFDGIEIHGANGYLPDQFLKDVTNRRTDEYGSSIENRARFLLDIIGAVSQAVGIERTAVRLSPWDRFNDMRMKTPKPTFAYIVSQFQQRYPKMAYLHITEPRVSNNTTNNPEDYVGESNDFIREIWAPNRLISCGAYTRETAMKTAEEKGDMIAAGRVFLANPDLPRRWKEDLPLNEYNRSTFYCAGDESPNGYTDYPFFESRM
ncbi:NADH:flavin oxidoreductase/NADH oxidase [Hymenopellis radicata]|nr:NADH:flavin oxidoreductase/NADH oxidase [Hymenopellis radicata]